MKSKKLTCTKCKETFYVVSRYPFSKKDYVCIKCDHSREHDKKVILRYKEKHAKNKSESIDENSNEVEA